MRRRGVPQLAGVLVQDVAHTEECHWLAARIAEQPLGVRSRAPGIAEQGTLCLHGDRYRHDRTVKLTGASELGDRRIQGGFGEAYID